MIINLNAQLKNLYGTLAKRSFPRNEEEKGQDETLGNVLLNALASFPIRDRKEIFMVNNLGGRLIDSANKEGMDISDSERQFLGEVVYEATYRNDLKTGEKKGVYMPVITGQVLEMLEIKN